MILHIDTSTDHGYVAISRGDQVIDHMKDTEQYKHSSTLTVLIKNLLERQNINFKRITAVHCNLGPGSYTSLRVGITVAKAICFAIQIPLLSTSSLELLASCTSHDGYKLALINARKNEYYAAVFDDKNNLHNEIFILDYPSERLDKLRKDYEPLEVFLFRTGELDYKGNICVIKEIDIHTMAQIGYKKFENSDFNDLYSLKPLYIKPPHITVQKKNLLG